MICLPLFFILLFSVECSGMQWYPFMVPIHTGGHQHRHTTHVVTHPVIRTRVIVLGDDDHHHHHNHGHNHLHKHGHDHNHNHLHKHGHKHLPSQSSSHRSVQQQKVHGRSNAQFHRHSPRQETQRNRGVYARHYEKYSKDGGGHVDEGYENEGHVNEGYDDDYREHPYSNHEDTEHPNTYSSEEPIRYSVPVHESTWKPLHHLPQGYLPLKYLGLDEERVAAVVKQAMSEIDQDLDDKESPVSYNNYRSPSTKSHSSLHRGAVYYDDRAVKGRQVNNEPRYGAGSYDYSPKGDRTFKLNIECQCEEPHSK